MPEELYCVYAGEELMYRGPSKMQADRMYSACVAGQVDGEPPVFLRTEPLQEVTVTTRYYLFAPTPGEAQKRIQSWVAWKNPGCDIERSSVIWDAREAE